MASNPLVAQGVLNRLRGSVVVTSFPSLNVTASYLARAGIALALQGDSTLMVPTMTGTVISPEPFIMARVTINLLRTQGLADQYKKQMEANSAIADVIVTPDTSTLGKYSFANCAIESVNDQNYSGQDPTFAVVITGAYYINNDLWAAI